MPKIVFIACLLVPGAVAFDREKYVEQLLLEKELLQRQNRQQTKTILTHGEEIRPRGASDDGQFALFEKRITYGNNITILFFLFDLKNKKRLIYQVPAYQVYKKRKELLKHFKQLYQYQEGNITARDFEESLKPLESHKQEPLAYKKQSRPAIESRQTMGSLQPRESRRYSTPRGEVYGFFVKQDLQQNHFVEVVVFVGDDRILLARYPLDIEIIKNPTIAALYAFAEGRGVAIKITYQTLDNDKVLSFKEDLLCFNKHLNFEEKQHLLKIENAYALSSKQATTLYLTDEIFDIKRKRQEHRFYYLNGQFRSR